MSAPSEYEVAAFLVSRLNELCQDDAVRELVSRLIDSTVFANDSIVRHPMIRMRSPSSVGFLGMLNGIVGSIPDGPLTGLPYIAASYSEEGVLLGFMLTEQAKNHRFPSVAELGEKFRFEFPTNFLNRNGLRRQQDREGLPAEPARADGEGATAQDPEHQASED